MKNNILSCKGVNNVGNTPAKALNSTHFVKYSLTTNINCLFLEALKNSPVIVCPFLTKDLRWGIDNKLYRVSKRYNDKSLKLVIFYDQVYCILKLSHWHIYHKSIYGILSIILAFIWGYTLEQGCSHKSFITLIIHQVIPYYSTYKVDDLYLILWKVPI